MKDFIIKPKEIAESGVAPDIIFYLLSIYFNASIDKYTAVRANELGYTMKHHPTEGKEYSLEGKGIELVERIFLNSEIGGNEGHKGRFELLAEKLRELYPSGKKPGTNYMWKDSIGIIAGRLKSLVKYFNADFTDEQAIAATQKYIDSFNGDYKYMQLLKYFIRKKQLVDGTIEESSQLLSYIENLDEDDEETEWSEMR